MSVSLKFVSQLTSASVSTSALMYVTSNGHTLLKLIPHCTMYICTPLSTFFQRRARVYTNDHYHCIVNTNNGVEAQNHLLKHSYLAKQKNLTLSPLMVEHFLLKMYVTAQFN